MIAFFELFAEESLPITLFALIVCVVAALIWVVYMMQLVTNEEEIAEKIRAEMRRIEEERRIKEDRQRARKMQERDFIRSLSQDSVKKMNGDD